MSDELRSDEQGAGPSPASPESSEDVAPEVAFVVPAAPYESIATVDATADVDVEDEAVVAVADAVAEAGPAGVPQGQADLTPVLEAVAALGAVIDRKLDGLQALFEREVRAEATREKVVDRLHAELQQYKQDLLLGVLRPLFVDLIQLHDDIGKMIAAQGQADGEVARLLGIMQGFQQGIEDILYRQGVEPYTHEGDAFDPRRQRAVATVPTDDPSLARTIAARHRKGFQAHAGERVIRPEIVSVYALRREG